MKNWGKVLKARISPLPSFYWINRRKIPAKWLSCISRLIWSDFLLCFVFTLHCVVRTAAILTGGQPYQLRSIPYTSASCADFTTTMIGFLEVPCGRNPNRYPTNENPPPIFKYRSRRCPSGPRRTFVDEWRKLPKKTMASSGVFFFCVNFSTFLAGFLFPLLTSHSGAADCFQLSALDTAFSFPPSFLRALLNGLSNAHRIIKHKHTHTRTIQVRKQKRKRKNTGASH